MRFCAQMEARAWSISRSVTPRSLARRRANMRSRPFKPPFIPRRRIRAAIRDFTQEGSRIAATYKIILLLSRCKRLHVSVRRRRFVVRVHVRAPFSGLWCNSSISAREADGPGANPGFLTKDLVGLELQPSPQPKLKSALICQRNGSNLSDDKSTLDSGNLGFYTARHVQSSGLPLRQH